MTDQPPAIVGRGVKHYIAMGVGCAIGWGTSKLLIRLGQRITNAISGHDIVEAKHADLVGSGVAILVYLGIIGFGWSKTGVMGDFFIGFGAGALIEELLALGA